MSMYVRCSTLGAVGRVLVNERKKGKTNRVEWTVEWRVEMSVASGRLGGGVMTLMMMRCLVERRRQLSLKYLPLRGDGSELEVS